MAIFQKSVLNKYLSNLNVINIDIAFQKHQKYFSDKDRLENIILSKEEQYQEGFLRDLFVEVLGYTINPDNNYNLTTEYKNESDSKKCDGAIIQDGKPIGVIELKSTKTSDLVKIEQQAFGYRYNHPDCKYVITSNFKELRLYVDTNENYEEFNLFELDKESFKILYLCLSKNNVFCEIPLKMKHDSKLQEESISLKLYKDYSQFKSKIFNNLVDNNPNLEKLLLLKKSQKLLDRLLFIFFSEDRGLLPPNTIASIIDENKNLEKIGRKEPLYNTYKIYFSHINKGNLALGIPEYNGGLFEEDNILDNLIIDDEILIGDALQLSHYDFLSDIDVNILGHIFENSLNALEEFQAKITGIGFDKNRTKRKKDGIFYTPKFITKYLVDNTLGSLCEEKKKELNLLNINLDTSKEYKRLSKDRIDLLDRLNKYRDYLLSIKILDPACGSGAFLNQALEYLINEHEFIDTYRKVIEGDKLGFFDVSASILEKNLYGVDINEEAVEIAKLSLWLHTAERGRKLNKLSEHIKLGNSLIDDPAVAGDLAFNWEKEFPDIMANGGFDVVIGNPPYIPTEYISETDKTFLENKYISAFGRINLYPIFYELGIKLLNNLGILGFVTPYTILKNQYYIEARRFILENTSIITLIDFKDNPVFADAVVDSIILILKNVKSKNNIYTQIFNIKDFQSNKYDVSNVRQNDILNTDDLSLTTIINDLLINKVTNNCIQLKNILDFKQGIITGDNKKYITISKNELTKKVLTGSDFNRYSLKKSEQFIIYNIKELHRPRTPDIFEATEKILLRQTGSFPICTIDTESHYTLDTVHNGRIIDKKYHMKYLLVLLNSKLIKFFYENQINETGKVFAQVKIIYVDPLPIKPVSLNAQQPFIQKADIMLSLNKTFHEKKEKYISRVKSNFKIEKITGKLDDFYLYDFKNFIDELAKQKVKLSLKDQDEWEDYFNEYKKELINIKNEIDKTDNEIDKMVYDLYELTEDEIKIIESNN